MRGSRLIFRLLAGVAWLVWLGCVPLASAVTNFWNNPTGGNYTNPANWAPGVVPLTGDNASFSTTATYVVTFSASTNAANAYFNAPFSPVVTLNLGGYTWTLTNSFSISTATPAYNNSVLLSNGTVNVLGIGNSGTAVLIGAGSCAGALTLANGGMLIATNGILQVGGNNGIGTLTVSNGGSFIVKTLTDGANSGVGTVNIYSGTNVVLGQLTIASAVGSTNTLLIAGNSTMLVSTNNAGSNGAQIAQAGSGSVVIRDGGTWLVDYAIVGYGGVGSSILVTNSGRLISGSVNMGTSASNNSVLVSGGSVWSNGGGLTIAFGTGSSSNSVTVTDPGSVFANSGAISMGYDATKINLIGNTLSVSNGAQMFSGNVTIGNAAGCVSNAYFVGGGVNQVSVSNGLINIGGTGGGFNTMVVTNASLWSTGLRIGSGGFNDTVSVFSNVTWNLMGGAVNVGNAAGSLSNAFNLYGGFVTNAGLLTVGGAGGAYNTMTVTNASLWSSGLTIGSNGFNNTVSVFSNVMWNLLGGAANVGNASNSLSNAFSVVNATVTNAGLITVGGAGGGYNTMTVTNASLWSTGLTIGSGSSNNTVIVAGDMPSTWNFGGGALTVGSGAATGNLFQVIGSTAGLTNLGGIIFNSANNSLFLSNQNLASTITAISLGSPGLGGNSLTLSNQTVNSTTAANSLGNGSSNNTLTLLAGTTWNLNNQNLTVGSGAATGNVLTVNNATLTGVGTLLATGTANTVVFNAGVISAGSATLSNSSGAAFSIGNGTNFADYNTVVGTHTFASGLLVTSNAWLTGNGVVTVASASGGTTGIVLAAGAFISPGFGTNGIGVLTINTNVYGQNGVVYDMQLNSLIGGAGVNWDLLQVSGALTNTTANNNTNFIIRVDGAVTGYSATKAYSLPIATFGSLSVSNFSLDTNSFLVSGPLGNWYLKTVGNSLYLVQDGTMSAANWVWTNAASANWSLATAWTNNPTVIPTNGGTGLVLRFDTTNNLYANNTSVTVGSSFTNNGIEFNGSAGFTNTLTGATNTFAGSGNPAGFYQLNTGVAVVSNVVNLATSIVFDGAGLGTVILASNIVGTGQITKQGGAFNVVLSGSNTFTGPVLVNSSGTLTLGNLSVLGTNSVTVSNGTVVATAGTTSYIVGNGWSNQNVLITGVGSTWSNGAGFNIGNGSATSNVVTLANGGNLFATAINVGNSAAAIGNGLVISNGGIIAGGAITIGTGFGSTSNFFNVFGGGTASNGAITIGSTGSGYNTMTVTNANLWSTGVIIGNGSSNNTVSVFSNVTWNMLAGALIIGTNAANANKLVVNGGTLTNVGLVNLGSSSVGSPTPGADSNSLTISNGGSFFGGAVIIGNGLLSGAVSGYPQNNAYNVGGLGALSTVSNGNIDVNSFTYGGGNTLTVTNANFTSGALFLGGDTNGLVSGWPGFVKVLTNATWNLQGNLMDIGFAYGNQYSAAGNSMLINGGTVTNVGAINIGPTLNGVNSLTISNGGSLFSRNVTVGNAAGSNSAYNVGGGAVAVTVSNGTIAVGSGGNWSTMVVTNASLWSSGLTVGNSSSSNAASVFANVTWNMLGGAVNIGNSAGAPAASNAFNITGGTVTNAGLVTVGNGASGSFNALTITNTTLRTSGLRIGINSAGYSSAFSNTVTVLANSVWDNSGAGLTIGYEQASNNALVVNGSTFTNAGVITIGAGIQVYWPDANNNSLTISNGGQFFGGDVHIGTNTACGPAGNSYNVGGLGALSTVSNGAIFVSYEYSSANYLTVTNANFSSGALYLGGDNNGALQTAPYGYPGYGVVSVLSNATWNMQGGTAWIGVNSGAGSGAKNNSITINGGTITNAGNIDIVHVFSGTTATSTGTLNSLTISNGGALFSGNVSVGNGANGGTIFSNSYNVGGFGGLSTVSNGTIAVGGTGSGYNTMTVTNANLWSTGVIIGNGSSNNTVSVFSNVTWNMLGGAVLIGTNSAWNNNLVVNGGTITNAGAISIGSHSANGTPGANSNSLTISNGGSFFGGAVIVGNGGQSGWPSLNSYNVGGLGAISTVSNGTIDVALYKGTGNTLTVTNANFMSGALYVGRDKFGEFSQYGNAPGFVTVLTNATWNMLGNTMYIGFTNSDLVTGTGNSMLINGGIVTNVGAIGIGTAVFGVNTLTISNGGSLFSRNVTVGWATGSNSAYNVGGFGALSTVSNGTITVGSASDGAWGRLTVTNANLWSTGLSIGANGSSSNAANVFTNVTWNMLGGAVNVGNAANARSNAFNITDGTVTNVGLVTVGSGSGGGSALNSLTITNTTLGTSGLRIGYNSSPSGSAFSNTVTVLANSVWDNSNAGLTLGYESSSNNALVVNGGTFTNAGVVTIGSGIVSSYLNAKNSLTISNGGRFFGGDVHIGTNTQAGPAGNSYNVGGLGAVSTVSNGAIFISYSMYNANYLTVTNANFTSGALYLGGDNNGPGSSYGGVRFGNGIVAVLSNATWNMQGGSNWIGEVNSVNSAANNNSVTINGGTITNAGAIDIVHTFAGATALSTGTLNSLTISNGGALFSGNISVGNGANGGTIVSNSYNVGGFGAISTVSNGTIRVGGSGGGFNTMTVTNATLLSGAATIGSGASNNTVKVQANAYWNLLGASATVGGGAATGNVLFVSGSSILEAGGLTTGTGAGNAITNSGSTYQFATNYSGMITRNGSVGSIALNSGTIAYRAITNADINSSQGNGNLQNISFSGANTFMLNAATNSTASQTYTVGVIAGNPSNYVNLVLANGATAYRGGDLTISGTGTLLVSNTTASIGGNLTNSGVVTIQNSPITLASNFVNQGTVLLGSNSPVTGLLTMNGGTLTIFGNLTQTYASNINLQATGTFDTSSGTWTLAGAVTNGGALVKIGSGVLTLAATNTYTGGTILQAGTIILGSAQALTNGTPLTVNSGYFDPNGSAIVVSTLNGTGGVLSNYGLTVSSGGSFSGVIAGPGGLVNTGTVASVLILSGNNTYSGGTTISNGALLVVNSTALGSGGVTNLAGGALQLSNTVTLANPLTLFGTGVANDGALRNISSNNNLTSPITLGSAARINADANQLTLSNITNNGFDLSVGGAGTTVVAQVIGSGSGGLLKDGTGALYLTGAQTYTGPTTLSNGTLTLNGSLYGAGVVNVFSNATLTGNATLGNLTISSSGTIAPGNTGVGSITAAALTLASNSQLALEFSLGARSYDQILVTNLNGLAISGGVLSLYKANTTTTFDQLGSYKLIQYSGFLSGTATNLLSVTSTTQNRLYGFSLSGGWVTLSITSTGGLGWVGSAVNDSWSTPANWAGGSVPQAGDQLIFDGHTGLSNTNDLPSHTQFSGIYFNSTADAFTLNSNAVDLINDVINLSPHTQTINLPLVLAASDLVFNTANGNVVINGSISETNGSFGLTKDGAGILLLTGTNTYSGGTLLDAGTLSVGAIADSGASGISTGGVLTFNGGALQFTGAGVAGTTRGITNIGLAYIDVTNSAAQLTLGGVISGNGLVKLGAGTLVLASNNTYSSTAISNGTLAISADNNNLGASGGALIFGGGTLETTNNFALDSTRSITLTAAGGTLNVDTNSTLTAGNTIGGSGALTKTGAGTLVFSNAVNNYGGGTVINAGILALGSDSGTNENAGALGGGLVRINNGAQLRLGGGVDLSYTIGNGIALSNGTIYAVAGVQNLTGSLTVNSGGGTLSAQAGTNDLFLSGVLSGSGALTVYDSGATTNFGRGLVRFANNNNTYSGTLTISSNENNGVVSVDAANALQFATVNNGSGYGNSLVFYQANGGATNFTLGALSGTANITLQTWTNTAGGDPLVTGSAVTLTVGGNHGNTTYAGALGGSGTLVKTGAGIMTLSGANTNSGVTVSSGTLLLSGGDNRLFTNGTVTVAGGTLNLGGFTQTNMNTFAMTGGVITNGNVAKSGPDYLGQAGTVSATLSGSAGLTKTTTNTLTLNGTQNYTGATTVSNGTLVVNGALFGAGLVNVFSNATLTGNATLGNVTVGTGGRLGPGNNGVGTLSMGTLTTASGSLFNFDFTATTNDLLLVTANNGLTVTGGVFTLYQAGTTQTFDALGTYNLIDYVGAIGGLDVTNFAVANAIGNRSYTFGTNSGAVTLTIAGQGIGWNGSVSVDWSDPNNWNGGKVPTNGIALFDGNHNVATVNDLPDHAVLAGITFATTADAFSLSGLVPGTNSVNLEGDVINLSPNVQTINLPLVLEGIIGGVRTFNASSGTLIVSGAISETNGVFTLVKEGTNLLVLTGLNTYSGGTVLNAGTLGIGISSIGSTGALGTGTLFIHAGGLLATNGAQTFNNAVGVVGDFSVGGNQTLTFAGALNLSNATRTLTINNTADTVIAGTVSNGALTKAGAGQLTVTGTLAYHGATTINGGTLQLGNGGNAGTINNNAAVTNNGVLAFDRSDDLSFANRIAGAGDVVQNGTNVVTISDSNNSYYGRTVINGGVLSVSFLTNGGGASSIGAASSAASNLVLNGGALQYTGSGATLDRLFTVGDSGGTLSAYSAALNFTNTGALGMSGTNSRTLVLTGSGPGLLAASLGNPTSGQTALLKTGTNLWALSNTNTYSGVTTISGGTLLLAGALAAQNSTVNNLVDGGLTFTNSASFIVGGLAGAGNLGLTNTDGGSITLSVGNNNSNTTYLGVLSGSGALTKLGSGTLTLSTNQTYFGGTTVSAGTLQLGGGANTLSTNGAIHVAGGVLNLGGATQFTTNTVTISSGSLVNGTLTKSGADYAGQGGTVAAVLAGDVGLTKTTGGTLLLTGTNTYTGATLISGGTLQITGELLTNGLVTVAGGATLAGNGGTVGQVTINSGGIVAPGISGVGTLTLTTLNVTNGSLFNYEFTGAANDQLFVTATNSLTLNGGVFKLNQAGSSTTFDAPGTYNLLRYDGLIQGSGVSTFSIDPSTQTGNRSYTFGTNGGWVTLTIAGQGVGWLGGNSALWSDPGNWSGNVVPTNGFAVFTGNSRLNTTNDLANNTRFAGLMFTNGAGAFTLNSAIAGANIVNLEGDVVNLSSNTQTINLPLVLAGAGGTARTFNASNANLVVTGNIGFDSYGSGLLKTGPNLLQLTGNNTYTGLTEIAGGILRANSGAGLPGASNLKFTQGVLESIGAMTLTRNVGTGAGSIQWAGSGGFSASGGTLTVNLGGGGTLVWNTGSFVPTGSALQFSSSQADSTVNFLNALDLNGAVRTIQVDHGSAFVDVDIAGAISGTTGSGLIKTGAGTLRLSGNSSYAGVTVVNDGTLIVNGTLASSALSLSSSGVLAGTGTLASVVSGSGFIAPGNSPGILTLNQLDPSGGLGFDLQFTSLGSPDYTQAGQSSNDVLRITNAVPFTVALGLANTVNLYVTAPLTPGITNIFRGGFYTDNSAAFDASIAGAVYHLYGAGAGELEYVKTVQETAFGKTGYVMEFGVLGQTVATVIPEPSVALMWLAGGITLWAARRRRRQHPKLFP